MFPTFLMRSDNSDPNRVTGHKIAGQSPPVPTYTITGNNQIKTFRLD